MIIIVAKQLNERITRLFEEVFYDNYDKTNGVYGRQHYLNGIIYARRINRLGINFGESILEPFQKRLH